MRGFCGASAPFAASWSRAAARLRRRRPAYVPCFITAVNSQAKHIPPISRGLRQNICGSSHANIPNIICDDPVIYLLWSAAFSCPFCAVLTIAVISSYTNRGTQAATWKANKRAIEKNLVWFHNEKHSSFKYLERLRVFLRSGYAAAKCWFVSDRWIEDRSNGFSSRNNLDGKALQRKLFPC